MGLFGKDQPESAEVNGKPLQCQVCGNKLFLQTLFSHSCQGIRHRPEVVTVTVQKL